ncbi:MAG: ABC transporter permease, partial [Ktedonobacteraceae bacterium]|nr:ABC transporter permease [Ktedonobacteraceae bacterium]
IALPLGILVARRPRLYLLVITIADLLYTVPALALIAILITITGLSLATAIIPLVIYTQLVLIRNTATAINGIDPLLLEVGKAMGMNPRQVLLRVALPQALPTIIAGVRIATVTTIGIAALAYLAGQSGLGDLIFKNIATTDFDAVVAGGILIALLAVVADLLLLAVQTVLNRGRTSVSLA